MATFHIYLTNGPILPMKELLGSTMLGKEMTRVFLCK